MRKPEFIITICVLVIGFVALVVLSLRGYGAPRCFNDKYDDSGAFFVSSKYSSAPSARIGSVGGPNVQGGGLHAGK